MISKGYWRPPDYCYFWKILIEKFKKLFIHLLICFTIFSLFFFWFLLMLFFVFFCFSYSPTNTPRGFYVETTWKWSFPRRFNVESTWCVCREALSRINCIKWTSHTFLTLQKKMKFSIKVFLVNASLLTYGVIKERFVHFSKFL